MQGGQAGAYPNTKSWKTWQHKVWSASEDGISHVSGGNKTAVWLQVLCLQLQIVKRCRALIARIPWAQKKEENPAQPRNFKVLVWRKRSAQTDRPKKGKCVRRASAAKNFGAKRLNAGLLALDARLESQAKEVLHERRVKSHKASQILKWKESMQKRRTDIPCLHESWVTSHVCRGGNWGNVEGRRLSLRQNLSDRRMDKCFLPTKLLHAERGQSACSTQHPGHPSMWLRNHMDRRRMFCGDFCNA